VVEFYKLSLEDLLIVCDDFNLPLGKLRVRAKGSHGGQKGLAHIQEQLGTQDYARLRIGVGSPRGEAVDHVLGRFKPAERSVVDEAVADAGDAALLWVREGIDVCMNRINGRDGGPEPSEKPRKKPNTEAAPDGPAEGD
jgi:PTH1 family peptidyl-tRNA hydrolase